MSLCSSSESRRISKRYVSLSMPIFEGFRSLKIVCRKVAVVPIEAYDIVLTDISISSRAVAWLLLRIHSNRLLRCPQCVCAPNPLFAAILAGFIYHEAGII